MVSMVLRVCESWPRWSASRFAGPLALAQDAGAPSSAKTPEVAATSPDARATQRECPSEPVTILYLNNPEASGGLYNNPWADCKLPASPR